MGPALNIAASSDACGVLAVNLARHRRVKAAEAQAFVDWLISPAGQAAIAAFRIGGQQAFFPNATR